MRDSEKEIVLGQVSDAIERIKNPPTTGDATVRRTILCEGLKITIEKDPIP